MFVEGYSHLKATNLASKRYFHCPLSLSKIFTRYIGKSTIFKNIALPVVLF
jgi:hypothetical protein